MIRICLGLAMLATIPASFRFVDRSADAGLSPVLQSGGPEKKWIMEANGTGVAVLDYDQDGFMDLLFVNGATVDQLNRLLTAGSAEPRANGVFLYRNTRDGKFENVTAKSKLFNPYWGTGANAADFDNDGRPDILITTIGRDLLFHNEGDGTFLEVSRKAGLDQNIRWHTGSAFGDYDGDGDLDLYIAGYVNVQSLGLRGAAPVCRYLELPVFCGPMNLQGEGDIFYRNDGDGRFTETTRAAELLESEPRYGFSVVFEDFNQDGKPDIFVANDSTPNYLYLNNGKGGFTESGLSSGLAFNADGRSQANMGVAVGDSNNDGALDVLTTTFSEDYFPLFEQVQRGFYEEVSARAGLVTATTPLLGWACGFVDFNNDGWRDLWLANGHVYPTIATSGRTSYDQEILIFENQRGAFPQRPQPIHTAQKRSWRGGASADFNNDGRVDLVVTPVDGPPALLENRSQQSAHWIGIQLRGQSLGARVTVEGCGQTWFDTARNGGSYLSSNDPRQHFGLGSCGKVARVRVTWPGGREQTLTSPAVDRYHTVQ